MANPYVMPPENLTDNGNAVVNLLVWEASQVNPLFVGFLAIVFFSILVGGAKAEESRRGRANYLMWMVVAFFIVNGLAFIAFFIPGLISLTALGILTTLTIGSAILFWFTSR